MIIELLFDFFNSLLTIILNVIPNVTLSDLPVIGEDIDSILTTMVTVWNGFSETVPYVTVVWHSFLYIIVPFEITMIAIKLVLGNRAPVNTN